jgi:hypothetical protein
LPRPAPPADPLGSGGGGVAAGGGLMSDTLNLLNVPSEGQVGLVGVVAMSPGFTQSAAQKTNDSHRSCRRGR